MGIISIFDSSRSLRGTDKFCFQAESWNKCVDKTIYLNQIIRQGDVDFQNILNKQGTGFDDFDTSLLGGALTYFKPTEKQRQRREKVQQAEQTRSAKEDARADAAGGAVEDP